MLIYWRLKGGKWKNLCVPLVLIQLERKTMRPGICLRHSRSNSQVFLLLPCVIRPKTFPVLLWEEKCYWILIPAILSAICWCKFGRNISQAKAVCWLEHSETCTCFNNTEYLYSAFKCWKHFKCLILQSLQWSHKFRYYWSHIAGRGIIIEPERELVS